MKFKVLGKGVNAGVQVRTRRVPNHNEVVGYQADLGEGLWGCLYDEGRRGMLVKSPTAVIDQTRQTRRLERLPHPLPGGPRATWINGRQTVDESATPRFRTGVIALQIHGGPPARRGTKTYRFGVEMTKVESQMTKEARMPKSE